MPDGTKVSGEAANDTEFELSDKKAIETLDRLLTLAESIVKRLDHIAETIATPKPTVIRKKKTTAASKAKTGSRSASATRKASSGKSATTRKKTASTKKKAATTPRKKPRLISVQERHDMIAEAAYYRALARDFQGGDSSEDWLAAEAEIDAILVRDGLSTK